MSRKVFRDPPSRHLARASKKRAVSNQKLGLLGPSVKTFRLEARAFFTGEKAVHKGAWPPCYARGAYQHAQNAARAAISPPDNENRFCCRTRRSYIANVKKRVLGKSGIEVSPLGLGCMGLTHASGDAMDTPAAARVIREAFEIGYTFFDTAESYVGENAAGETLYNEVAVGEALRPVRDQVVIATKFGVHHNPDKTLSVDSRPETIRRAIDGSLSRLGIDCIDLYYQHRTDPNVEPEEVAGVMAELMQAGKIRAWGISEVDEDYLRRADAVCPVAAVQNRYSMLARWHEPLFPVLEELNVVLVAFSPMANGFLTGAYSPKTKFEGAQDYRDGMPQYTPEGYEKDRAVLGLLGDLAREKNATMAQISLAWMLCKKPWIIPIPGSRKPERLRENLEAAQVSLTAEEVARIDAALDGMNLAVFGGHARA